MINELKDIDLFNCHSKLFKKYFIDREPTEKEKEKRDKLKNLILDFYQKVYNKEQKKVTYSMFNYDFCGYGYMEDYGYYVIQYDTGRDYRVINFGEQLQSALIFMIREIMTKEADKVLRENRRENKKDFKTRTKDLKYFESLYQYEYELKEWKKYFNGELPKNLIELYLKFLNHGYDLKNSKLYAAYNTINDRFVFLEKPNTKRRTKF